LLLHKWKKVGLLFIKKDLRVSKDHIWMLLTFSAWGISYFSPQIGEYLSSRLYFFIIALVFLLISFKIRNAHWLNYAFFELCVYNLSDEIIGLGDSYQWYELPIFLIVLITSYFKFYIANGRDNSH